MWIQLGPNFLAGSKRSACPHSTFMFQEVGFDLKNQTMRLAEKLLKERLTNDQAVKLQFPFCLN
jgi:hypothetical protein